MKSIRLSLIVYFLALLAVALGAIGALAYGTTKQSLREKKESTRELLLARHASRSQAVREEWDERILRRAQTLASLAQSQFGNSRYHELFSLGLLSAGLQPNGHVAVPLWLAEGEGRVFHRLRWLSTSRIQFADEVLTRERDGQAEEYFQIYSDTGKPLQHSEALAEGELTLDPGLRSRLSLFEWSYDDTLLYEGPIRRVTLKAPVARFRMAAPIPYQPPAPGGSRGRGLKPPYVPPTTAKLPTGPQDRSMPAIFIQCAFDTEIRDATLAEIDTELAADLASLESEARATLADLRRRLLWTGLATFIATIAGGYWLVRLGLSPLHRLSDAVSQVSERDFRLPIDRTGLPAELQPIAERLAQTLDSLERAFDREKQAAADISHELRTPLSALLATTELALRKARSADEYRELFRECQVSGQHMSRLVERLLALARVDAGADPLHLEALDGADLAEQCAGLVRPLAEAHGLNLQVHCAKPLPFHGDAGKIREIVSNLLHNAVEYNKPNGSIDVTLERHNGTVRIEVRDTGIGISREVQPHIFERFYRADPSRQADGLHAGLGLAITKSYVDLMGGTIAVDSTPGEGSRFRVDLPVRS